MKTITQLFFLASLLLNGCIKHELQLSQAPVHFKTELPYRRTNDGLMLMTYWGADKTGQELLLDNHSPTWGSNMVIKGNKSVHLSTDVGYKTTTGDGSHIKGDIYVCDSVFVGGIPFKAVAFYKIADDENLVKYKTSSGVIGDNIIIAAGVWKIDFRKNVVTIASNLDSIQGIEKAIKLPAFFDDGIVSMDIQLAGKTHRTFELDLGLNATCLMPLNDFTAIYKGQYTAFSSSLSTPAGSRLINCFETRGNIKIGTIYYPTPVYTHTSAKEFLIGLAFFERFDFIVMDYVNKAFYVSTGNILSHILIPPTKL